MIRCAALGCVNDEASGVSLFALPDKPKMKRKWEANLGRTDLAQSSAVCEVHFADSDLAVKDGVKFMKAHAVPTMFGSQRNEGESEPPIRRSNRNRPAPNKRANRRTVSTLTVAKELVGKTKTTSTQEERPEKPQKSPKNKTRKTKRLERAPSPESEDVPRKLRLVLDGADERGHAIAEWYLLDIFEATRLIMNNLHNGTVITDKLVANVEETIIDVISKLLQRVSSVILTSIEEEFGIHTNIRKILSQLDGEVSDAVRLMLEEDKEELNQPEPQIRTGDVYEETLQRLDPSRDDQNGDVEEEVISPATEDCQVLLEHSYSKDIEEGLKGSRDEEKSKQEVQCGFCGFKTFWKGKLRRHLRLKHLGGERNYSCPRCAYVAQTEEGLQKHFRTHTGSKPFACEVCNFCTANKSNLSRHMLIHTGEKPFQCVYCERTFRQKVSLMTHIRCHIRLMNEENPKERSIYACGECGFVTVTRSEWVEHSKIHKQYKCGHCDFVSSAYSHLKKHQVEHRGVPHICSICSHKCHNADELRLHMETHAMGVDIVCNICGYRTTKKSYLNRHIASHLGERSYKCETCPAKFRTSTLLNVHVRRHEIGPYCRR